MGSGKKKKKKKNQEKKSEQKERLFRIELRKSQKVVSRQLGADLGWDSEKLS